MKNRFRHRYTLPAIVLMLIITLSAIVYGIYQFGETTTYPNNNSSKMMGIQLDQNRGYVDFKQLEKADVDFVYLRSTQGKSYFDDRYLESRDRLQGTNLDYGTIQFFSDESTADEQFTYFQKKVGPNTGNLPILINPAVENDSAKFWQALNIFAGKLVQNGKKVVVLVKDEKQASYLNQKQVMLMSVGNHFDTHNLQYKYTQYTTNGRLGHVQGMDNLTMYTFIGSQSTYNQMMGRK